VLEPYWTYLSDLVRRLYPGTGELEPQPMKGGASTRRFFRISLGKDRKSAVAMFVPGAPTHEIHKVPRGTRWPFLEVRDLLAERGIRVPTILADGTDHGWLVVEDLGDDTIANYLLRRPGDKLDIYRLAVRDLARAQRRLATLPQTSIVKSRAFDHDLLRWEIDHFLEWGLAARNIPISSEDRTAFEGIADRLAAFSQIALYMDFTADRQIGLASIPAACRASRSTGTGPRGRTARCRPRPRGPGRRGPRRRLP